MKKKSLLVIERIRETFERNLPLRVAGVFILYFLLFSFYFFLGTFTSTDDQFFNIRFSAMIREEGFSVLREFDWFAFMSPSPWISNLLFYVFLIPFTAVSPLEIGIKLYGVMAIAGTFGMLYYFFSTVRTRYPFLYTLLASALFLSAALFWRLLNARAFVLAPAFLLLELVFLLRGRYVAAGTVSFLYFFWHTGTFFFPLIVAFAHFLFLSRERGKPHYESLAAPILGMLGALGTGILLIPGFFSALVQGVATVVKIVFSTGIASRVSIDEGVEVYPTNIFDLYRDTPILMVILVVCFVFWISAFLRKARQGETEASSLDTVPGGTLFLLSSLFLLGSFVTKRMLDFFAVFSVVFTVYSLSVLSERFRWKSRPLFVGLVFAGLIGLSTHLLLLADSIGSQRQHTRIQGAAEWLSGHTDKGEIVFNPTINFFPTFFFFNKGHNRVIVGAEPRGLYEFDQKRYWLWYNFSNKGIVCDDERCPEELAEADSTLRTDPDRWYAETGERASRMIREDFSSRYVIVSKDFERLSDVLENSGSFEKVYEDSVPVFYSVYRVK